MPTYFDPTQPAYTRLRDIYAERLNSIVVWCGSGLSMVAGLPNWSGLRRKLEAEIDAKAHSLSALDAQELRRKLGLARRETNYWVAFQRLKKLLGRASYVASIREALSPALKAQPPTPYHQIWSLRPKGVMNLNLDRFATRAFSTENAQRPVTEFTGRDAGKHAHALKGATPFIANLHGVSDDESSWVFTHEEIKELLDNDGYRSLVDTIFSTYTVLFMGASADDIAVGGLLAQLRTRGTDPGQHFWISDRLDAKTDKWAESHGIQIIRYDSSHGHDDPLGSLFADLLAFRPVDDAPTPILPPVSAVQNFPEPQDIASKTPEEIRQFLSAGARRVLAGPPPTGSAYDDFCRKYARALHNAWYVELDPPNNVLFGRTLTGKLGQGAFGTVYSAADPNGKEVAVKLLRQEIRDNQAMLGSFRRGVGAMKILKARNVEGMVPYLEAYELPPCVVMERVPGPDLEQIVHSRTLELWPDGLRVVRDTANIVHAAHCLPERVLHRDLRPANIMLQNFYTAPDNWSVVVLDFDLSWHLGATEKSIVDFTAGAALGYLAPEQLMPRPGVTTRSTAVDAYGLSMTAYFVFTGQHPRPGEAISGDWQFRVRNAVGNHPCKTWHSAPRRLARMIVGGTHQSQYSRFDMSQLRGELERLLDAVLAPETVQSPELWAEELMATAFPEGAYDWNDDQVTARLTSPTGWALELVGNNSALSVEAVLTWMHMGSRDRRTLERYVREASKNSENLLRRAGWTVQNVGPAEEVVMLRASVPVDQLRQRASKLAEALSAQRDTVQRSS